MSFILFLKDTSVPHCSVRSDRIEGKSWEVSMRGIRIVECIGVYTVCNQKGDL